MLAAEELQEVRSLLLQPHVAARRVAVGIIASWPVCSIDHRTAQAILEAATDRYPCIVNDAHRPTELFVKLLWGKPHAVSAGAVVEAAIQADLHARWALIQLLLLRHDAAGVQGVEFLMEIDGFVDLLSPPTSSIFALLLQCSAGDGDATVLNLSSLAAVFADLLWRPGWSSQTAQFLRQLHENNPLDGSTRVKVVAAASDLIMQIVPECNAAIGKPSQGISVIAARDSLAALAGLMASCAKTAEHDPLYVMLGSADPHVSVTAVVALVDCGLVVGADRIEMLARDPQTLSALFRGLDALGQAELIAAQYRMPQLLAQAELVEWLSQESELGRAPDEIESLGTWQLLDDSEPELSSRRDFLGEPDGEDCEHADVELFRFRMCAPHWSCQRGWMIGVAGALTHSCYSAEDEFTSEQHLYNLQVACINWPSTPPS
ncbi:MAG: hypothetical protein WD029_06265 [Microthrixaceae bacterium]